MKKTGKALSLVLSLALVVSSLTATFASAATATRSEVATVKLSNDTIALSNGGLDPTHLTSPELLSDLTTFASDTELSDHSPVGSYLKLKDVVITSGADKAKLEKKDSDNDGYLDTVKVVLKTSSVKAGTISLAARYEAKVSRVNDDDTRVYGTATFNVKVYDSTKAYIAGIDITKETKTADNNAPADLGTMARNNNTKNSITGVVEKPTTVGSPDAGALWLVQTVSKVAPTTKVASSTDSSYKISTSGISDVDCTTPGYFTVTNNSKTDKLATAGKITVRADEYRLKDLAHTDQISAKTAVNNKYIAGSGDKVISKYSSHTYIGGVPADNNTKSTLQDISSCDVELGAVTTMSSGKIGDVTGGYEFTVNDGSVGDISSTDKINVNGGSVGKITVAAGKALEVNDGSTKDIDGTAAGSTVEIRPTDDDSKIVTGAVKAVDATIDSGDGIVTTGDITLVDSGNVTLKGEKLKVGKIDGDYRSSVLTFEGFKGSVAAPVNGYTVGLQSERHLVFDVTSSSDVTLTGPASLYEVGVDDSSSLTFADKVNIGDNGVTGDGVIKFAPNALYTTGGIMTSVRLTKPFKVGDVVFTAATDTVDPSDFKGVGFATEKVATSSKVDSFKVSATSFASLNISGSPKIPVGTTETYTASTYPDGTKLPEGDSIAWTFSGNDDYLSYAVDAKDQSKVTVKAIKADTVFPSLNQGTLTAYVVDASGDEVYDYPEATFNVSIGPKSTVYTSDTNTTLNLKIGQQYTYKITSSDGSDPKFGFGTGGIAKIVNTTKSTSGNTAYYYYTVEGVKEGSTGIYVADGTKVNIATVKGLAYKSDTSKVTVKAGKSYTFKITADSKYTAKVVFQVCGFSAKNTVAGAVTTNNKDHTVSYLYTITNNGTANGTYGAYVNGVRVGLVTAAK